MSARKGVALAGMVAMALVACSAPEAGSPEAETPGARTPDATAMIDLSDVSAWRGYGRTDLPTGWRMEDGLLTFVPGGDGGDIITRERFGDFELELEWRVGPAGNSGVFYRARETDERIYANAPEMQILDDAGHNDGRSPLTSAGALYALYPVPEGVVKPAGEWNHVRIVARGPRIEHWLNGVKVVEAEVGSDDWNRRLADSKFADIPDFGAAPVGYIGLQDHGDRVWFRNIRVHPL